MSESALRLDGLTDFDRQSVEGLLGGVLPHIDLAKTAVVGGVAIAHHAAEQGVAYPKRPLNDLDLIVSDQAGIRLSVTETFRIAHHHHTDAGGFYFSLVEPNLRASIDVFGGPDTLWPDDSPTVTWNGHTIRISGIEDQLAKTIIDISRISADKKVDPKQFDDATTLLELADLERAEQYWRKWRPDDERSLEAASRQAFETAKHHPDWVQKDPFKKPPGYVCPDCVDTPEFPLTSLSEIDQILGKDKE